MDVEEALDSTDIVEYISQYVDLVEKNGEYWGLSPFKEEKTPSFSVRKENGTWYDFSSGKGGNLFTFIKEYNRCNNSQACEILKKYMNNEGSVNNPNRKLNATKICKAFSRKQRTKIAKPTGNNPEDYMERFEFDLDKLKPWIDEGMSIESLVKFRVLYDSLSNRIVYPITDLSGNIVNIGGRTLEKRYKEKGLRKYTYFNGWGGQMAVVYGVYENIEDIKEKREIIIFEGMKSVLIAREYGYNNCGAILTSHLNPDQLKILVGLGVRVVFALDSDVDITEDKNIQKLKRYCNVEYIKDTGGLLAEKDSPVDRGRDVFEKLYRNRIKLR